VRPLPIARRPLAGVLALTVAALLTLSACAGGGTPPAQGGAAPGAGFPARVTHRFGTTEIPAAPQRVVSLGYTDQDAILALGVVPVAIREFTGGQPSATWPWAQDRLQGQQPTVLPVGEVSTEAIAALQPDLIVGISAGLTREQYDTYSKIAPTISRPEQYVDYGTPWQDVTTMVGTALGRSAEAGEHVADLEARFAAVRAQYPAFAGRTAALARPSSNDSNNYFVWGSQDLRARFFASMGLTVPPEFDQLAGKQFYASISTEELGKLDSADLLVLITADAAERQKFESLPGYPALKVVQAGHVVALDDEQSAALSFSSVLSLPEVLDSLPPQIAKGLGTS
jgi:iron complex transport system substrate-binding protein